MKATLQRAEKPAKENGSWKLTFTTESGEQHSRVYGRPQYVTAPFEVGHEDELELESKKGEDGGEYWVLKSWGAPKAQPQRGGGGGGWKATPKTPQEIHSASVCGILKSCIEAGLDTDTAKNWVSLYQKSMGVYQ